MTAPAVTWPPASRAVRTTVEDCANADELFENELIEALVSAAA